ncbi:aminopeptidase 1 [Congregibacter variabilis]|uniref:M18 family aminopeptidase n=1 Tax=Congregibacter variabilis TaxID=3081200 RepID=A0ABZ0I7B7_9GAMM|nr:aminopeptidase 1 [Congregibacter sp. IMCC43200]
MSVKPPKMLAALSAYSSLLLASLLLASFTASADDENGPQSAWQMISESERSEVFAFAEDYKDFMSRAKTELSFVSEAVRIAEEAGFKAMPAEGELPSGGRYYDVNRDRTLTLFVVGSEPMTDGFRVVGAHVDSPRLELKGRPLYESEGFALFQTYRHGGIKNYQWVNLPLALVGHVDKKDGSRVSISVGLSEDDPIFIIPDLSPHVDQDYRERTNRDVIMGEELDPIIASITPADSSLKDSVLGFLKSEYNIEEEDLVSAELAIVPAVAPRDIGFDRGMMAIYGQDDKLSSYTALRAIVEQTDPKRTAVAFLVDNEEVGNVNNTGSNSDYFVDLLAELVYRERGDAYTDIDVRRALRNTKVVSSDVNPGVHPSHPGVWEAGNAPRLGYGVNLKLYGGGFNANSEFMAWNRAYLDGASVKWQTATYKGRASGGTIGNSLSRRNMEVIDYGVPVLSIHSTYAISSKVDVHMLYRAMDAFYRFAD